MTSQGRPGWVGIASACHVGLLALLVFAFCTSLYALSFNAVYRADDEHILAARSQSLALWGRWIEPQVYGNLRVLELEAMGPAATQIEPLQALLGAGLSRLGESIGVGGGQAAFTLNLYVTAATAAVVFLIVVLLGLRRMTALWAAGLYAAGTMAWPYATTYFRDPLASLMTTVALLGWVLIVRPETTRVRIGGAIILAVAAGAGMLAKNTAAALVPAIGLTVVVILLRRQWHWRLVGAAMAGVALMVLGAALIPANGPLARYSLGYLWSLAGHFAGSLNLGLVPAVMGPFLSPAKSIFLFSPALVLALPRLRGERRVNWQIALPMASLVGFLALGQALFYRDQWAGVFGWGLRFMLPALPPMVILASPSIEYLWTSSRSGRSILVLLLIGGAAIQISGAFIPWQKVYADWQAQGLDPYMASAAWSPRLLAIPAQLASLVRPATWDGAWIRLFRAGNPAGVESVLACTGAAVLVAAALRAACICALTTWRQGAAVTVVGLAALSLPVVLLRPALSDPGVYGDRAEFRSALAWLNQGLAPTDTVVLDAYAMPAWYDFMNRWTSKAIWYSLPFDIPGTESGPTPGEPSPPTLNLLTSLAAGGGRLWYVTSDEAPDYSVGSEVAWLGKHATLVMRRDFLGVSRVEVRAYQFTP